MKKITWTIAFVILVSLFTPSQAAQVVNNISGTLGVAENGCVLPIAVFIGLNCEFSGGPTHASELALYPPDNIGGLIHQVAFVEQGKERIALGIHALPNHLHDVLFRVGRVAAIQCHDISDGQRVCIQFKRLAFRAPLGNPAR